MSLDMNPEIRAQWCAALRSGDYPQTREALYRPEPEQGFTTGYCCLGVLTDLWLKAGHSAIVPDECADNPDESPISVWEAPEGILCRPVMEWAGLADGDPLLDLDAVHGNAVIVNDDGRTFAEIADLIDGGAS